ncbi:MULTISPECIES: MerR family transcriptional regulator [unclassified Acinetobacter]|uniref:MerR family transcriptional regulator n=1 Tax=unclassified Acinetobacter TaxID=196816 RepID=UPI002934E88B|nr:MULTISPECIES: MerR family transcriptional regulator [unclassified Acinetobacter]WOE30845.1 MerR family transcriptional regulator [Acinetobacter sp. SAAs470]WOE39040.1 MerR family transcriptional regulator [Acinetobacter sp. SAAs474]
MLINISQLAKKAHTTIDTIRFYEKKGLLLPKIKASNHYRYYDENSLYQLNFILNCRHLGLSVKEIIYLLKELETPEQNCHKINELIAKHTQDLEHKIHTLTSFKQQLDHLKNRCENNQKIENCYIVKHLQTHD